MAEPRRFHCVGCRRRVTATSDDHYRKHDREKGAECARSKRDIPTWLLKRGPETGPETDTPVKGRDYADCPQCDASPVLDGATGCFTDHTRQGETPTSPRVPCPMSGQTNRNREGAACETNTADQGAASPSTAAPGSAPRDDACPPSQPESSTNQSEEMISKWAATAREIEDRKLPPSPESTTTPPDSPPRPDAPEAPPAPAPTASPATSVGPADAIPERECHITKGHGPHKWMYQRRQAQCLGKPAPSSKNELGVAAVERLSRKAAPTPPATPADSAAPTPVDALVPKTVRDSVPETAASPATEAVPTPTTAATATEPLFAQPGSPFSQPAKPPAAVPAVPMTVMAERLVARMREIFYSFGNRKTDDNRSAQATLGPSDIGSPCDRRLAMSLLRIPPVNPGGDGWAAFKGTAIHKDLAEMFTWASGNTGRFAVEVPLTFPNDSVPHGTSDLLDRVLFMVDDHKIQSRWSQDKLKTEGMTPTQRAQLHVYGYGARLQGEQVDSVAILSWPMESSTLDDMYAVVEPYDPAIARDALARVDGIADAIATYQARNKYMAALDAARQFPIADDCKFCNWYAPGDAEGTRGCNGRQ